MTSEIDATPFAVVDVETTGFSPARHDRIIEVAVVRLQGGQVVDTFTTLVNPKRDVGPTHVHGITATEVEAAPTFQEVAGDVARLVDGAVLVGHNLRFDRSFLDQEFHAMGATWPDHPGICTLQLSYRFEFDAQSRKLAACCQRRDIPFSQAHTALYDASATAKLFLSYVDTARSVGADELEDLGVVPMTPPPIGWRTLNPAGRTFTRREATETRLVERSFLARLVERLPATRARDAGVAAYLEVLTRAVEDRRITFDEGEALNAIARDWGLPRSSVVEAHRLYLADMIAIARADGIITIEERADLNNVREILGLTDVTLEVLLDTTPAEVLASATAAAPSVPTSRGLAGKQICFTGELQAIINGERVEREHAEQLARDAGAVVRASVVKKLDILVAADTATQSGKAQKARAQGVQIMSERGFWSALGITVA